MQEKTLKTIDQILLLAVIAVLPFVKTMTLYFPFISGKAYLFRGLVAAAFFFWSWLAAKHRNYLPNLKNILVLAVILFFAAQVFVSLFSVDPFYSFFSSIDRGEGVLQYGFWVLFFLMLASVFREESDWKAFFGVFIVVALALSVYSFFDRGSDLQPDFSGIFGNPAYFGAFLLFAIGFSLIAYERKLFRSAIHQYLPAVAGFFTIPLILTTIRGVYAGLAGGVFLFCVLTLLFFRKENKKLAHWCLVILLAEIVSVGAIFAAKETAFVKNSAILSRVAAVSDFWGTSSVRERLLNWNIALKAFAEKPLFGWGPENYGVAANKYYDFRIGQNEPWFDRAHSQPFDILATGGIVLFSFYLFWIFAVFCLIYRIFREKKILSFLLASVFFAYLIQAFFLFDTLAIYLGLFPFLAYLVFLNNNLHPPDPSLSRRAPSLSRPYLCLVPAAVFSSFIIYATVIVPWRVNHTAWYFYNLTQQGFYKETKPYLQKALSVNSPYTYWALRKMTALQFMNILENKVSPKLPAEKLKELQDLYDFLVPEFEKHIAVRPSHPQMYHVLANIYLLGFEKLGKDDLAKAEALLKKAFKYSDLRVEYFNDFAKVALAKGDFAEAEKIIKSHTERMPLEWGKYVPFTTLGNFYFEVEKYKEALAYYDKAREAGFQIEKHKFVYPRYMLSAEKLGEYERIVEMGKKHLEYIGPDADTYFNIAVGYWHLKNLEKAKEFFLKAVEIKPKEYEQYKKFFAP